MKEYILSIAGVILIASVVAVIAPGGKMGQFVKGTTRLFLLIVMISPLLGLTKGDAEKPASAEYPPDPVYFQTCAELLEARDEENIGSYLCAKYDISARVDAARSQIANFDIEKISVIVAFQGIIGDEERINILTDIREDLENLYGCVVEVS